uniref:hypothetical protein n=1 Tax=Burkholderia gladioli TaxID=28095 RepID=UPI001ABB9072
EGIPEWPPRHPPWRRDRQSRSGPYPGLLLFQSGKFGPEAHTKIFGYSTKFAFERAKDRWTAKSKSKASG